MNTVKRHTRKTKSGVCVVKEHVRVSRPKKRRGPVDRDAKMYRQKNKAKLKKSGEMYRRKNKKLIAKKAKLRRSLYGDKSF